MNLYLILIIYNIDNILIIEILYIYIYIFFYSHILQESILEKSNKNIN